MGFLTVVARVSTCGLLDALRAFDLIDALKTFAGEMLTGGCVFGYLTRYEEQLLTDWIEPNVLIPLVLSEAPCTSSWSWIVIEISVDFIPDLSYWRVIRVVLSCGTIYSSEDEDNPYGSSHLAASSDPSGSRNH